MVWEVCHLHVSPVLSCPMIKQQGLYGFTYQRKPAQLSHSQIGLYQLKPTYHFTATNLSTAGSRSLSSCRNGFSTFDLICSLLKCYCGGPQSFLDMSCLDHSLEQQQRLLQHKKTKHVFSVFEFLFLSVDWWAACAYCVLLQHKHKKLKALLLLDYFKHSSEQHWVTCSTCLVIPQQ